MKKLLFFHHCGTVGGAGISGLCFLDAVPKDTYDIIVYCVSKPDGMVQKYRQSGYQVIEGHDDPFSFPHCVGSQLCALSPAALRSYLRVATSAKVIDRVIREQKPDLVVANSMTLFWIGKLAKKYGAQTLCFFRETYIHGWFGVRTAMIKAHLSKYFDKIAFISNYELVRTPRAKSIKRTIYNMVPRNDYDRYTKQEARALLGLEQDVFYVLFVGGISKLKGTKVLLDAFCLIKNKQTKLLLVGGTMEQMRARPTGFKARLRSMFFKSYNRQCLETVEKNHLQEQILFFPNQSDISPFFRAADLLVCPMTAPHQARPVFEAGYAGVPVVITDFENIYELVDNSSGYLFENKNYKQLAQLICNIQNNYADTASRVEKNYRNTVARHSPEVYKQQIEQLLSE